MNLLSKIVSFGATKAKAVESNWNSLFSNPILGGSTSDVWGVLDKILDWLLIIAGFIAVLYLILAGITYITAGGNPDQAKKGQQGVINASIGIIIILAAYFIINVVISTARTGFGDL